MDIVRRVVQITTIKFKGRDGEALVALDNTGKMFWLIEGPNKEPKWVCVPGIDFNTVTEEI